jgi:hypothetical protein
LTLLKLDRSRGGIFEKFVSCSLIETHLETLAEGLEVELHGTVIASSELEIGFCLVFLMGRVV